MKFFFNDVVFSITFETIFLDKSVSERIGHKINLKITFPTLWPPKKCHILLATRILRKIFPKFFFIHIISPKDPFKIRDSVLGRHRWIMREPNDGPIYQKKWNTKWKIEGFFHPQLKIKVTNSTEFQIWSNTSIYSSFFHW